jgi:TFIIF-interacting CTD phosphatase-like protein
MDIYYCSNKKKPKNTITDYTLVLDIDETLVRTFENLNLLKTSRILKSPTYYPVRSQVYILNLEDDEEDADEEKLWGLFRPHLSTFLDFAFNYFKNVCVWSAGSADYVHEVCRHIFTNHPCPDVIFTRNDCDNKNGNLFKPLTKLYDILPTANQYTTVMIDDRDDVMSINLKNGIVIPPYNPILDKINTMKDDDSLLKIIDWFQQNNVVKANDIRSLNKNSIFS